MKEKLLPDNQEDASKQGKKIDGIDKDAEITLVHETRGRYGDGEMFNTGVLDGDEVLAEPKVTIKDVNLSVDEVTLAQTLVALASTYTIISSQQPSQAKIQDKGKAKMIEPEPVKKLSKKDQLNLDKEVAQRLKAEFDGQERIEREKAEANIALKETWDDIQAKIEAEKRRKHFAAKRAEEKRNRPTTKAQQRSIMCTYLKIMEGWKPKDLKNKSFNSIQKLFDKAMKRIAQESSSKRVGDELEQKSIKIKKQKVDEDKEKAELQRLIEVVSDKEEIVIDAIPLSNKPPSIVEYKIHKEGKKTYYQIIRDDESSKMYLVFSHMLKSFNREDLETLWKLVKAKHGSTRPEEGYERVLWGDLKTMFDPHVEDQVWRNQQDYRVLDWKLYDSCGVHSLRKQNVHIHMLVEKRYPLTPATITDMLNRKLQADHWNEMIVGIKRLLDDLGVTAAKILDLKGAIPLKSDADAKVVIQEMAEYSKKWHNGTSRSRRPHYTKDFPLKEEGKTLEESYYTQFGGPFQGGGYIAAALGFYQRNNANPSYQERRQSMEDTLSKFMSGSAKWHKENSNLIKEIRASTDVVIRNQRASIKPLEIQTGQMSKVLQERGFRSLPSSTESNPRDQVKSISTTIKADSCLIRRIGSSQYAVSTRQNRTLMYETRQMMIPFPSHLNGYYCEEKKGSYGPQFLKSYSEASQSIPQKEKDPWSFTLPFFINNVCFDNSLVDLGARISVMPLSAYLNLGLGELAHTKLTVELADGTVKYPKGIVENVLVSIGKFVFLVDFIILDMLEDIKVPWIHERQFLSTTRAKIDVYKRKITLRVGEERIIFTSVKPASSLIKRVYMLSLRERMELDLEARLMGETLVLNRSLDPFFEDYIELNDLNEPFELRRNQGDDLMPTIEEGEVIGEFRTRDDKLDAGIDDYPSYCDYDKKIHIDCSHNLKFSCMIGFEFTHANFFPLLYVNVMSKKFHNSIMKDKMVYKGNNVIGALMNVPIFVGTFSVVTDFAVLENMDAYRDEGMGDVIFGEAFLREVRINAKRFEGMITIYNGNDEVTYQMVRSHPRFKHHTNEQCNKIPPLLKVSDKDKMNGILHSYQKLKGFYKGVLNLGPDYILDVKMEEWLARGHVSVHEMK
ncbi:putative reverse transcriptase domain-containing protein [Tanacetum coccineum]